MPWSRSAYTMMLTLKDGIKGGAQHLTTMEACENGAALLWGQS